MDHSEVPDTPLEQDWDADDFEIPSLKPEKEEPIKVDFNGLKKPVIGKDKPETGPIYLGPHGAPPSQLKQQELNFASGKKKRKQKLKDAEKKGVTFGRENKVETIHDLMGGKGLHQSSRGGSQSEWLDPHCHESQFERLA